jgi:hypothetical protein
MSIQFRETQMPADVFTADYTKMNEYNYSFNVQPRTSLLRFAISPGQKIFSNLDFNENLSHNPKFVPYDQSLFIKYDPRIKYLQGLENVKQRNDYIQYQRQNQIPIDFKDIY